MKRESIYGAIDVERERQEAKHGDHTCMSPAVNDYFKLAVLAEEVGEVAEELIEKTRLKLRKEMIQVAAVCVAWLESMGFDRKVQYDMLNEMNTLPRELNITGMTKLHGQIAKAVLEHDRHSLQARLFSTIALVVNWMEFDN